MALICINKVYGLGPGVCDNRAPMNVYSGLIFAPYGFSFADAAAIADKDNWDAGIIAGNLYPVQRITDVATEDTEGEIFETALQEKFRTFRGKRGAMYSTKQPLENHKIAYADLNRGNWTVFYVDKSGAILCTQNADGTFSGFTLGFVDVDKLPTPAPGSPSFTMIRVQEEDNAELDENGFYLDPTWNPNKLFGPTKVKTSSSTVSTNIFTVSVYYQNLGKATTDTSVITGLDINSFKVIDQTGAVITPDSITETATLGTYTVTATGEGMTSGSVQVIPYTGQLYFSDVEDVAAA